MKMVVRMISFFRTKSEIKFFITFFLLFSLRLAEFAIDYLKGDGNGSMTSPIGLLLNATYLILILLVSYYYSTVEERFSKKHFVIGVILIGSVFSFASLQMGHGWGDDFSLYIAQTKALNENSVNELQEKQKFTTENSAYILGPQVYPWGYPLLMSPVYKVVGLNLSALKFFTFLFFTFSLLLIFYLFGKELGQQIALFIALFSFSPQFYNYKDSILSDIPFMFFALLGLSCIQIFFVEKRIVYRPFLGYILTGVAVFFAYSIKTVGIVLLPTLFTCQLYDFSINYNYNLKHYLTANRFSFLSYLIFFLALLLYSVLFNYSNTSYLSHLDYKNFYEDIQFNIFYYINSVSEFFEVPVLTNISKTIWGVCLPFVLLGVYINREKDRALILFVVFMISIMIIAPYQGGLRYIFPILPIIFYFLLIGLREIQKKINGLNLTHFLFIPFIIIFLQAILIQSFNTWRNNENIIEGPFDKEGKELMNFINSNTLPDDVIVFYKPRVMRLLTGRNGFVVNEVSQITDGRADILVIQKDVINDWFPEAEKISTIKNNLQVVFENKDFYAYRISPA